MNLTGSMTFHLMTFALIKKDDHYIRSNNLSTVIFVLLIQFIYYDEDIILSDMFTT